MRYLKLYGRYLAQQLKASMADRGDFLVGFLTLLLYQGLTVAFIGVIFLNVPEIRGRRFAEVLFILGFFHVTTGLFYLHFAWTLWFADGCAPRDDHSRRALYGPLGVELSASGLRVVRLAADAAFGLCPVPAGHL